MGVNRFRLTRSRWDTVRWWLGHRNSVIGACFAVFVGLSALSAQAAPDLILLRAELPLTTGEFAMLKALVRHQDLHPEGDLVLVESGVHTPSDEAVHAPSDQAVHTPSDDDEEAIHPAASAPGAAADVPSDRDVLPPGHADGVRVRVGVGFDVDHRCGVRGRWPVRDGVRPGRVVHVVGDRLRR